MGRKSSKKKDTPNLVSINPCKTSMTEILIKLFREKERISLMNDIFPAIAKEYLYHDISIFKEEKVEEEIEVALRSTAFYGRQFICVPKLEIHKLENCEVSIKAIDAEYVRVDDHRIADADCYGM
jgi:hypothetical protein